MPGGVTIRDNSPSASIRNISDIVTCNCSAMRLSSVRRRERSGSVPKYTDRPGMRLVVLRLLLLVFMAQVYPVLYNLSIISYIAMYKTQKETPCPVGQGVS